MKNNKKTSRAKPPGGLPIAHMLSVVDIINSTQSIANQDKFFERIVNAIYRKIERYYHVSIFTLDESNRYFELRTLAGDNMDDYIRLFPNGYKQDRNTGIFGEVLRSRKPYICNNVKEDLSYYNELTPEARSELCVPIKLHENIIGLLNIESYFDNTFEDGDLAVFEIIANHISNYIENVLMYEKIEESEKKFRTFFDQTKDGIYMQHWSGTGEVFYMNRSGWEMLGFEDSEKEFIDLNDFYENPKRYKELMLILKTEEYCKDFVVDFKRKDDSTVSIELTADLIKDENGEPVYIQGIMRDITERLKMEQDIQEKSRRMTRAEVINQILATLAHHINNSMGAIYGAAQLAHRKKDREKKLVEICMRHSQKVITVLKGLEKVIKKANIQKVDYPGLKEGLIDIDSEIEKQLKDI